MSQNIFAEYYPCAFLAIGLIILGLSVFLEAGKSKLKQTGTLVDGIIFKQEYSANISVSSFTKDKVTVRFVTLSKEWITAEIEQDFQLFYTGQYTNGETVKVYYEKDNPSNFYIDTKQSELFVRTIAGLIGLIFLFIGLFEIFM